MKKSKTGLRIVKRAKDKHIRATIYGFVYDDRKINMEKINEQHNRSTKEESFRDRR